MTLKKRALNILLFAIAATTGLMLGKTASILAYILSDLFSTHVDSYVVQLVLLVLIASLCRLLVHRLVLSKKIIILLILVFLVFSVLHSRYQFYYYHDHPDFGDMKNVPECIKESNYATFWEYLNKTCHLTIWELVRSLSYKTGCWLVGFFGSGFIISRMERKKSHAELIDEPEE